MWIAFAFGSAFFAGITAVLAKLGIRNVDSNLATALRTIVVLVLAWVMVFIVGSEDTLSDVSGRTWLFLVLSGLATGGSWLCYFRALQIGDLNKVVPVDKSSTVLAMILAVVFLGERLDALVVIAMVCIGIGTLLMIELRANQNTESSQVSEGSGWTWLVFAAGSAIFAALTAILGKVGIEGIESNLGTAIRTAVLLVMAWLIVLMQGGQRLIPEIDNRSWMFLLFSGVTTGLSWLCFYRALQDGPASVVVPIDKLSILVSIGIGAMVFHERLSQRAAVGLVLIVGGTLALVI
ncbi:MAG: EamA family transporter [Thermomicrobiales bacterium]|nr:EamA family transporter [Thermomicrobiales bacterium]